MINLKEVKVNLTIYLIISGWNGSSKMQVRNKENSRMSHGQGQMSHNSLVVIFLKQNSIVL